MEIDTLLNKPLWQMTGEEFMFLAKNIAPDGAKQSPPNSGESEKRYVYGLAGIMEIFHCSISTASRIKSSGVIDKAIKQKGRTIVTDVELALKLFGNKTAK